MSSLPDDLFFRLTGAHRSDRAAERRLRPALFARFGDLTHLRYDLPAVLVTSQGGAGVRSLTSLVDLAIRNAVPRGMAGEHARTTALRVEREIRVLMADGKAGRLSFLWDRAVEQLARPLRRGVDPPGTADGSADLVTTAGLVRGAIADDGELVDCDARGVALIVEHLWRTTAERRAAALRGATDQMIIRLEGIVAADAARSSAGRDAEHLRVSIGAPQHGLFDFDEMARLVGPASGPSAVPPERRERIVRLIAVLRAQRGLVADLAPYIFDGLDDALAGHRERLPAMAELLAALASGELEIRGAYLAEEHDRFFEGFDERALTPEDLARFPDVLVRVRATGVGESIDPVEACATGAPLKILVETADAFGTSARLAMAAVGLGDVFVVQAASSDLVRIAGRLSTAMEHRGAALLSVFVPDGASTLPAYLVAAAATESRAFPTFTYDPSAGGGWPVQLSLEDGPQLDRTWPEHDLTYADEHLQRVSERVPFTLADFAICDELQSADLAPLDGGHATGDLVPLGAWLDHGAAPSPTAVPYVNGIDENDRLVRLVVDDRLVRETRRSGAAWKRLVELCSPPVSAVSPSDVTSGHSHLAATPAPAAAPGGTDEMTTAPADVAAAEASAASADGAPYIETVRCATCNECTNLNPRMFQYNENKQAYIADLGAGTYRELVEAAEACQVAIIHPGKPRDPNEPGLTELLERAAAFA